MLLEGEDSDSDVDLRKRMEEERELLDEELSEEEIKRQMAQTDHIRFQLKIKELGEEKLLKLYSNVHAQEREEDEQLEKFILDQTKKPEPSLPGSKPQSKTKEAEPMHIDRRKGQPVKTTIVSSSNKLMTKQTQMLGKKKVMPEPGVGGDEKKAVQTLTSSKTTD